MTYKQFKIVKLLIVMIMTFIIVTAVNINNFYLALTGVLIGILFMFLVKAKFKKITVDERIVSVGGKAARLSQIITILALGCLSVFFIVSGQNRQDFYTESLGVAFSYIILFNIAVYSISFRYYNKQYGGNE